MTVRVTVLKGDAAGRYYLDEGGLGRYYLDDAEPAGQWWGSAAAALALQGSLDADGFLAVLAGLDPATGRRLGRRYGEASVRGYDTTLSAPKSVSLLFAFGDPEVRQAVIGAHDQAVAATLGWLQSHAHTRMRVRGHVVTVDAQGLVVATFRQHTSRALDPQLHTHAVIANRVPAGDGRWLALDARTLLIDQRTLSALYHANLRAELTRTLGVEWGSPEHGVAEMAGVPSEVLKHFSQRSGDVARRLVDKLRRFERDMSRSPTRRERWRLEREAAVDSRPAKPHGHEAAALHGWWNERLRGLGKDRADLVSKVIGRQRRFLGVDGPTAARMVEEAVTSLVERQSTWRQAELVRELAATVPTGVTVEPERLTGWLDRLAEQVGEARCVDVSCPVPTGVPRRRDGRPITEAAVDRALTTQAILDEEEEIIEWAERRLGDHPAPTATPPLGQHLGAGQQAVAVAVAAGRPLELVIGPAGTGKTTALEPAVRHLEERGRAVFGVTPNAAAAHVLGAETGMRADTLDKLLHEHRLDRPPDPAYALPPGATVIVDEAGAVSTPKVAQLARLADQHRWRVVLVGDPRQFSPVGRGGMFEHLVASYGASELDQVHRFVNPWERTASLRLRTGDPTVLAEYDRRGRLHQGTPADLETEIIAAWRRARRRSETVALMANSNDTVERLNLLAQRDRIERGELDPAAPRLSVDDMIVHSGDEVVTRRNDRTLRTDQGLMVKNRDHWTVQTIHADRSLTLTGPTGTIRLPAGYIVEDLDLGYAQTSHATQGRTVDVALLLIDGPTDNRGVYTPMTRGRHANHAYVVTDENRTARDVLGQALTRDWIDRPAVAHRADHDPLRRHQTSRGIGDDMAKGERTGPREAYGPGTSTDGSRSADAPPDAGQPAGNSEEVDKVLRRVERLIAERERHSRALEARHRGTLRRGQGIGLGR